jgi:hypothetical protein
MQPLDRGIIANLDIATQVQVAQVGFVAIHIINIIWKRLYPILNKKFFGATRFGHIWILKLSETARENHEIPI